MHELLILAGGFGTRLRSVVSDVPKPLAPVAGRPYLDYLIDSWVGQGVARMTFLLHHQAGLIEAFLNKKQGEASFGRCEIDVMVEAKPLGTGGALAFAVSSGRIGESFLVANADTWLGAGIAALDAAGPSSIGILDVDEAGRYGRIDADGGKVLTFNEKAASTGPGCINAGLYHLRSADFSGWDGSPFSLERDLFPALARRRELGVVPLDTQFIDIGIPEDYMRFCRWIEAGRLGDL